MFSLFTSRKKIDTCAAEWLSRLQSAELSEQQKEEFFSWLKADASHQQAYIAAEKLWERSEVLKSHQNAIVGRKPLLNILNIDLNPAIIGSVCSIALVIVLSVFWFSSFHRDTLEYQTTIGEQLRVHLSDGSELILNTDSSVRVDISSSARTVFLERGEALFDVHSDEKRPFDVVTRSGTVRVKGTVFSVFDSGEQTIVTVVEGQVALAGGHSTGTETGNSGKFQADITLSANEQIALESSQDKSRLISVSANTLVSWRDRKLIYREEPLINVLRDVNRYYDTEIVIGDESLADQKLFGVIVTNDFDKTLRALEEALGLKSVIEKHNNRAVLYTR